MTGRLRARADVPVIGGEHPLSDAALAKGVRSALGTRRRRQLTSAALSVSISSRTLLHHPMWLAKILTAADRPPFKPKVTPNVVFVDAVSGYRGVLEVVPGLSAAVPDDATGLAPVIRTADEAGGYVQAVLRKINRNYLVKKPRHTVDDLFLAFLPIWKVELDLDGATQVYINGNNGEPETYLAAQWGTDAWLDVHRV